MSEVVETLPVRHSVLGIKYMAFDKVVEMLKLEFQDPSLHPSELRFGSLINLDFDTDRESN